MTRKLACCTWALSGPETDILAQLAGVGIQWIDVQPNTFIDDLSRQKIKELSLGISCVGISFGLPQGAHFDAEDPTRLARALAHAEAALDFATGKGATAVYTVPGKDADPQTMSRYAQTIRTLADRAAQNDIKLCIEHFPGTSLPTIAATLDFVRATEHSNVYLLLDIGHAQMSDEDISVSIDRAGDRLGYVHLDDNDGENDLHLSLTDGVLTKDVLRQTFTALAELDYAGGISLELSANLPDPLDAIQRSWDIVQSII